MTDQSTNLRAGSSAPGILPLIIVLASVTAFTPFATDMYLASFSQIAERFSTDIGTVQLGLSLYFLGMSFGQLLYGPLIDRIGRRGPLLLGVAIFVASSLLIVVSPDIESFIALRFAQALGGCAGMIVARAIIRDLFDEREGARTLSLMMMVTGVAPIVAPLAGSYLLLLADWRAVFLFLTVWGAIGFFAVWRIVPESLDADDRTRENLLQILATYFRLLMTRGFVIPCLSFGFIFSGLFAYISGSPYVYMELHGVSPQLYGWLFGANAVGMMLSSQLNRILLKRYAPRTVFSASLLVNLAAGIALVLCVSTHSLVAIVIPLWFSLATLPLVGSNAIAIAMTAAGSHAGSGSALIGLLQFAFASVVSALVGILQNGTAYPMTGAILLCGVLALMTWRFGRTRS